MKHDEPVILDATDDAGSAWAKDASYDICVQQGPPTGLVGSEETVTRDRVRCSVACGMMSSVNVASVREIALRRKEMCTGTCQTS